MAIFLKRGAGLGLKILALAGAMAAFVSMAAAQDSILDITNGTQDLHLSLADLDAMEQRHSRFETIWGLGGDWQGVALTELLAQAGLMQAGTVRITALDGYAVDIAVDEIAAEDPILATRVDGQALAEDNMGPLMLTWPGQAAAVLSGRASPAFWVWSVSHIAAAPH